MRMRIGIKSTTKKGIKVYITTDGTVCTCGYAANARQKVLNEKPSKKGVKVGKNGKSYHGKGGNVGVSPEKRRAIAAFTLKHNISIRRANGHVGTVVSMNRLLWAIGNNKKALKDFVELFAIP